MYAMEALMKPSLGMSAYLDHKQSSPLHFGLQVSFMLNIPLTTAKLKQPSRLCMECHKLLWMIHDASFAAEKVVKMHVTFEALGSGQLEDEQLEQRMLLACPACDGNVSCQ